jgi:F0F1-type ATP synthase assembly protein I
MELPPNKPLPEEMSARLALQEPEVQQLMQGAMRSSLQLSTSMLATVLAAGGLGYGVDYLLHTTPLFSIIFFFLGAGLAFFLVIKSAQQQTADLETGMANWALPPKVADSKAATKD